MVFEEFRVEKETDRRFAVKLIQQIVRVSKQGTRICEEKAWKMFV